MHEDQTRALITAIDALRLEIRATSMQTRLSDGDYESWNEIRAVRHESDMAMQEAKDLNYKATA